jgi:hypothetical protein
MQQITVSALSALATSKVEGYCRLMTTAYQSELDRARAGETEALQDEYDFRLSPHAYPGLRSFSPREGGVFFGRETHIREIQRRLAARRVVVVLGGSGSGKSSVIRAGLMPRLNSTLAIEGRSGNWYAAEFRPRQQPMDELVGALARLVHNRFSEQGPAVPEASGSASAPARAAPEALLARLRRQFALGGTQDISAERSARKERARTLASALFNFVDTELDRRDDLAARGLRSGRANLLLLIDQFEEVFRPEVPARRPGSRQDLLDLIVAVDERLQDNAPDEQSGLFLAITMRSEELHRCTEHPSLDVGRDRVRQRSLADMVNSCGYLLGLLDPTQDREQLTEAIVGPARRVFKDWGLLRPTANNPHAPFEPGVVDWLLDGAARMSEQLEHRADLLPLLQHGLQTIWHNAIGEWSGPAAGLPDLAIKRRHLLGGAHDDAEPAPADFIACLNNHADHTFERARLRFIQVARGEAAAPPAAVPDAEASSNPGPDDAVGAASYWRARSLTLEATLSQIKAGGSEDLAEAVSDAHKLDERGSEAVIRAAFRALAQRDDRGNWARRFAEPKRIMEFVRADPDTTIVRTEGTTAVAQPVEPAFIVDALREFIASGYLSGGPDRPYDISHEALIRNWRKFKFWLIEPDDAAQALVLAVNLLDLDRPADVISPGLARSLAPLVGRTPTLPESWAKEQILPLLARSDVKIKWSMHAPDGDPDALASAIVDKISIACKRVEWRRLGSEADSYWFERYEQLRRTLVAGTGTLGAVVAIAMFVWIAALVWRALAGG